MNGESAWLSKIGFRRPKKEAWIVLPVVAALTVVVWLNGLLITTKISTPWPNSPWESAIICDAWRMSHGQAIYVDVEKGPSPMMYGPLMPFVLGKTLSMVGTNLHVGRVLSLLSSIAATGLIAFSLTRGRPQAHFFAGWIFLTGVNLCSKNYFVETRPDMEALLFSVAALLMLYRGHCHRKWAFCVGGTTMLIVAFFFKQTTAMFSAIPPIVCLLEKKSANSKPGFLISLLPLTALLITIGGCKVFFPWVYHYMIGVNSGNLIQPFNLQIRAIQLFSLAPLFLVALFDWLKSGEADLGRDAVARWIVASLVVVIPTCVITAAPSGGDLNALIPAWLVLAAFCVHRSGQFQALLANGGHSLGTRLASSVLLAALILLSTCGQLHTAIPSAFASHGDQRYEAIIRHTASLPGKVVCPQDPTIPLFAKGYAGRSLYAELSHAITDGQWPTALPKYVLDEMAGADYVIQMSSSFGGNRVTDDTLEALHFRPASVQKIANSCYVLWKRDTRLLKPFSPRVLP